MGPIIVQKRKTEGSALRSPLFDGLQPIEQLLELSRDLVELQAQVVTDRRQNGDDDNRDESRDETVFDSGRARLVLRKASDQILHHVLLFHLLWICFDGRAAETAPELALIACAEVNSVNRQLVPTQILSSGKNRLNLIRIDSDGDRAE
jgi:hypothetical protein